MLKWFTLRKDWKGEGRVGLLHFLLNLFTLHTHCFQLINKSEFNSNHVLPVILLWESWSRRSLLIWRNYLQVLSILRVHAYVFYLKKNLEGGERGGWSHWLSHPVFSLYALKGPFPTFMQGGRLFFSLEPPLLFK